MPRGRDTYQEAAIQGRLWHPRVLLPTSAFTLLDASDRSTISCDGSGNVSSWADPYGGQTVAQGTSAYRPNFDPQAVNGFPGVKFAVSTTCYLIKATHGLPTGNSPWFFMSLSTAMNPSSGGGYLFGWGTDGGSAGCRAGIVGAGSTAIIQIDTYASGIVDTSSVLSTKTGPFITAMAYAGVSPVISNFSYRFNGTAYTYTNAGSVPSSLNISNAEFCLGKIPGYASTAYTPGGSINKLLILKTPPSAADTLKIEGWACWSVGYQSILPASHPYRNGPPLR